MEEERSRSRRRCREDFIVRVIYNEHATWQGEIVWVEKQEKQYFRSALELIKLIDNALDESNVKLEEHVEWA